MSRLVSVVTPAYRVEAFIGETIDSVLAQTYEDIELLVVDDASPDGTAAVVRERAERDPRVRLIRQPRNGGPAATRTAAVAEARGGLVAFLDGDDLWLPEKLALQVEHLRAHPEAALSFTSFRKIDEQGRLLGPAVNVPLRLDYAGLLKNTAIATSTVLVDRERTGPFRLKQTFYDDYALWLDLLKRGRHAVGLNQDLARYRIRSGSWSRNKLRSARHVWSTYRDVEGLGLMRSAWCFAHYGANALRKHAAARDR
jgi:teichuronic acid biosynthesis glycosyltransferase TuaG